MRLFLIMILMLCSVVAFGQDTSGYVADWVPVDPVFVPPSWLESAVLFVQSLPGVGPVVVLVGKWAAVLLVVINSFAGATIVSLRALTTVLSYAGLVTLLPKIEAFGKSKFIYWLKYVSSFNAQKK